MPEFDPRGIEYRWPEPWERIGDHWLLGCREHRPTDPNDPGTQAAMHHLAAALAETPNVYWHVALLASALAGTHGISTTGARQLLRSHPGSVLVEDGSVWCTGAAAPGWQGFRRRVLEALPLDQLRTYDEVCAAVGEPERSTSVHAALYALAERQIIDCGRDPAAPDETLFVLRRLPVMRIGRHLVADDSDLLKARAESTVHATA